MNTPKSSKKQANPFADLNDDDDENIVIPQQEGNSNKQEDDKEPVNAKAGGGGDGGDDDGGPVDPFDNLDALTISQDFEEMAGAKKALVTVPIRKPGPAEFIRVHPGKEYRQDFACLELDKKKGSNIFLVAKTFTDQVEQKLLTRRTLYLCKSRQQVLFLWPVRLPVEGGDSYNEWFISAHLAAKQAMTKWTRVWSNTDLGAHEHKFFPNMEDEPEWPDLPYKKILSVAFKGIPPIDSHDHSVMKYLRGE